MPLVNNVARWDNLVALSSGKSLDDALTEYNDKSLIEHNLGHVGLVIGKSSQRTLAESRGMAEKVIVTG